MALGRIALVSIKGIKREVEREKKERHTTTESVAGQTMNIQAGDNTIEITQASLDDLELSAEYKALPN